jgi:hypothetical protein
MNNQHRENLRRVADALGVVAKFDIGEWIEPTKCGTAACIGGPADLIFFGGDADTKNQVGAKLGLSPKASCALFYSGCDRWPSRYYKGNSAYDVTAAEAANLLRDIAAGKVVFDEDARRFVVADEEAT